MLVLQLPAAAFPRSRGRGDARAPAGLLCVSASAADAPRTAAHRAAAAAATSAAATDTTATRRALLLGATATVVLPHGAAVLPARAAEAATRVPPGRALPGGVTPSAVIKGCWQLSGGHRGDRGSDRTSGDAAVADFAAFVDAGITTFDTGPEECGYGPSESIVGDYLRSAGGAARGVTVNSKLCCVGREQHELTTDWVAGRVERTLGRLGTPSMGLMQLYWNDLSSPNYTAAALALQDLKAAGKVAGVAYTNFDTATLEKIRDAGAELSAHQIQYSLLDRRPEGRMAELCRATGMKLLPYGVVAGGFLSDAYLGVPAESVVLDTSSKRKYAAVVRQAGGWDWLQALLRELRAVGDRHGGQSVANVATRWVLDKEIVGGVILGARNAAHVADHVALFSFALTPDDNARIADVLARGKRARGDTYQWERGGEF